jgi:hypothetical protein
MDIISKGVNSKAKMEDVRIAHITLGRYNFVINDTGSGELELLTEDGLLVIQPLASNMVRVKELK